MQWVTRTHIPNVCLFQGSSCLHLEITTRGKGSSLFPCYSSLCNHGAPRKDESSSLSLILLLWESRIFYYLNNLLSWGSWSAVAQQAAMHLRQGIPKHKSRLGKEWIVSSPGEKGLGLVGDEDGHDPAMYTCSPESQAYPGLHHEKHGLQVQKGILPLCCALVRPHLERCIQLWGPSHKTDMDQLEQVQRRDSKMIRRLEHLICDYRLRELGFSLRKTMLWETSEHPPSTKGGLQ